MKKRSLRMVLCAVLVFSMLALAACGSKGGSDSGAKTDDQVQAGDAGANADDADANADDANANADDADDSASSDGKFASMEEYISSDEVQGELESLKSSMESQGMVMEITGEGNKLVYSYTMTDTTLAEAEEVGMAELLADELEKQKATFTSLASQLKLVVAVDDPVVEVRYLASDGEIYTQEFPAE